MSYGLIPPHHPIITMTPLRAVEPEWLRILNRQDEMLRRCATVETRFNKAGVEAVGEELA